MNAVTGIDPGTRKGIAVTIDNGIVTAIEPEAKPEPLYLSAGLIDLQVNGYAGIDLNSGKVTPKQVLALCEKMVEVGVTTWLPTLITASESAITAALEAIAEARDSYPLVFSMVPAVHVEGPSISAENGPRGAHPLDHVRSPSVQEFFRWQKACNGLVGLVTLAPEHAGAVDYIRALTAHDVHVALGHTAASPEDIHRAVEAGAALSTHLGNGAAAMLPRHPNFIWAQLADDRLSASLIADGWHLPADTFKAMLRAKGLERSILVSDSVALAGMPPGIYQQAVGGAVEVTVEGRIGMAGTPYLAGAGLPLSANVAIAMDMAELTLEQALRLATKNPGRFVGGRGNLAVGQRADVVRFDWTSGARSLDVRDVWVCGERVFSK